MLEDPLGVDRRLREVARSLQSFRAALCAGRGEDHAFEHTGRFVSLELVSELADARGEPIGEALLRWALHLHEEHAVLDAEREHAVAARVELHALDVPERGQFTLRELLQHALVDTKGQRQAFLDVLIERATRATDRAVRCAEQRAETRERVASALRDTSLGELDLPGTAAVEAARRWLEQTHDAWRALDVDALARVVDVGLGRDSRAAWPVRVSSRAIAELLREGRWSEHTVAGDETPLPALGAASFLRGFWRFGATLRASLVSGRGPFVLGHDPYGLDRSTFGALFAGLACSDSFARRELGVSAATSPDHRRTLAQVRLVATREAALRVLLRAPALGGRSRLDQAYSELTHTALGLELPPAAFGVLFTPRPADAQRFAGVLLATALDTHLLEAHDEDWYRNPRAVEELHELARLPAETTADPETLEQGANRLLATITTGW
jgi:hypothetical protein